MQYVKLDRQPDVTKFRAEADGIEVWHTLIHKAGTYVPQHAHPHPHLTVIGAGGMRAWLDGAELGDFFAPSAIYIPAGTKHLFLTLADNTALDCIHNVSRRGHIEVAEEHQIVGDS
jgi:quercetin dioxygenase-like cupin family protein